MLFSAGRSISACTKKSGKVNRLNSFCHQPKTGWVVIDEFQHHVLIHFQQQQRKAFSDVSVRWVTEQVRSMNCARPFVVQALMLAIMPCAKSGLAM